MFGVAAAGRRCILQQEDHAAHPSRGVKYQEGQMPCCPSYLAKVSSVVLLSDLI